MHFNNIAIITARKGSKRIINKNLRSFNGRPIIYYSIKALQKTKLFNKIIVSTNCDKTEKISRKYGIKDIIRRPNYLSSNNIGTITVINHAIKDLKKKLYIPKIICCLYPAAPLTKPKNIIYAYNQLNKKGKGFIYPSTKLKKKIKKNKITKGLIDIKKIKKKEGIVNDIYLDAGQFWIAKTKTWENSKTVYKKNSSTFCIEEVKSDINTFNDWKEIEKIYLRNKKKYVS